MAGIDKGIIVLKNGEIIEKETTGAMGSFEIKHFNRGTLTFNNYGLNYEQKAYSVKENRDIFELNDVYYRHILRPYVFKENPFPARIIQIHQHNISATLNVSGVTFKLKQIEQKGGESQQYKITFTYKGDHYVVISGYDVDWKYYHSKATASAVRKELNKHLKNKLPKDAFKYEPVKVYKEKYYN